ncbi:MAG TPA: CPBP family intramembrane glutamic endopeptidase, partial [Clostridia bacterium]|nr:CPBP family intramembrane glutamic endopeptidase [Clostridia bacterium]
MKTVPRLGPMKSIIALYVACGGLRVFEYLVLRTDQSVLGEAFVHKLAGILILALAVWQFAFSWYEIGFAKKAAAKKVLGGLLLGAVSFTAAYGTEFFIQASNGNVPTLRVYVTGYIAGGNRGHETGLMFFAFCIIGNIINVVMEEGVFRGLFIRLAERRYTFAKAAIFSSVLFGLWHIAAPVRSLLDGEMNAAQAAVAAVVLVFITGLTGFKFCLLTRLSGSLWMPMADHFFNNTIINLLHVVTASGTDALQVVRIS